MTEFFSFSIADWVKQLLLQSPALVALFMMWRKESKRSDNLLDQLLETQASTIQTLTDHRNLLELIKDEVKHR